MLSMLGYNVILFCVLLGERVKWLNVIQCSDQMRR